MCAQEIGEDSRDERITASLRAGPSPEPIRWSFTPKARAVMTPVEPERQPQDSDGEPKRDPLDDQEEQSFPASDPHSDWAGPAERGADRERP